MTLSRSGCARSVTSHRSSVFSLKSTNSSQGLWPPGGGLAPERQAAVRASVSTRLVPSWMYWVPEGGVSTGTGASGLPRSRPSKAPLRWFEPVM